MSNLLEEMRNTLSSRITELEPQYLEYIELLKVHERLAEPGGETPVIDEPKAGVAKTSNGRGRPSSRPEQVVEVLRNDPGLSISEVAEKLKMNSNYLYRIVPQLVKDERLTQDGDKRLFPVES